MKLAIHILFILSILFSTSLSAQFAVVADEGGFVNVYDEEKEELDRLGADGVVAIENIDEEWAWVDYTKYGDYAASSGYIKKLNLIDVASFKEIPLVVDSSRMIVLANDEVSIKIFTQKFDSLANIISYFADGSGQINTINEDVYWGTKAGLPTSQYQSIVFEQNEESYTFPDVALFNLFNPHLSLSKAYYDEENSIIYLIVVSGDATGAYTAVWIVEDGEYAVHYIFD